MSYNVFGGTLNLAQLQLELNLIWPVTLLIVFCSVSSESKPLGIISAIFCTDWKPFLSPSQHTEAQWNSKTSTGQG